MLGGLFVSFLHERKITYLSAYFPKSPLSFLFPLYPRILSSHHLSPLLIVGSLGLFLTLPTQSFCYRQWWGKSIIHTLQQHTVRRFCFCFICMYNILSFWEDGGRRCWCTLFWLMLYPCWKKGREIIHSSISISDANETTINTLSQPLRKSCTIQSMLSDGRWIHTRNTLYL